MANGRNAVYHFICDTTVPASNPPDFANVTEAPGGFYNVQWRTPAACGVAAGTQCGPSPPAPPPVPPPAPCAPGAETCLPKWTPTWDLHNSTVLYTCNNSGMHSVESANHYGVVVYDWSNAKDIWANAHPMTSEELITKQAELVYAADPGVQGSMPRVWAYRCAHERMDDCECGPFSPYASPRSPRFPFSPFPSPPRSATRSRRSTGTRRSASSSTIPATQTGLLNLTASQTRRTRAARASRRTTLTTSPRATFTTTARRRAARAFTTTRCAGRARGWRRRGGAARAPTSRRVGESR
jgi:hypothetical protein